MTRSPGKLGQISHAAGLESWSMAAGATDAGEQRLSSSDVRVVRATASGRPEEARVPCELLEILGADRTRFPAPASDCR
jgi:hypothetical protein